MSLVSVYKHFLATSSKEPTTGVVFWPIPIVLAIPAYYHFLPHARIFDALEVEELFIALHISLRSKGR